MYDCLARDLVEPQLHLTTTLGAGMELSLIEMSDDATVIMSRRPVDQVLVEELQKMKSNEARSHGNYLPALNQVEQVLEADMFGESQLFVFFLSDGSPSDHCFLTCDHGVEVWQPELGGGRQRQLQRCPTTHHCRQQLRDSVSSDCLAKVRNLGDIYGTDRLHLSTIGFGSPQDDYTVLQRMTAELPRNSFQKLGLSANSLKRRCQP